MRTVMTTYVGIGSNLGDRAGWLRAGIDALGKAGLGPQRVSSVWESTALGAPAGREDPDFYNLVVACDTSLPPRHVLDCLLGIEREAGRRRTAANAPRNLDLDLLRMGETVVDEPGLTLPHPRMWQRRFVLEPLAELAPDLTNPANGNGIEQECARLRRTQEARSLGALAGL